MNWLKPSWQAVSAIVLCLIAVALGPIAAPKVDALAQPAGTLMYPYVATNWLIFGVLLLAALISMARIPSVVEAVVLFIGAHLAAWLLIGGITGFEGLARAPYFLLLTGAWLLGWRCVAVLSGLRPMASWARTALRLIIPAIFGAWILIIWEAVTRGAGIPFILLPPPSAIGARIAGSLPVLGADVRQTIFKAVIFGYVVGSGAGFITAILADRVPFLRRGLLPIGNMVSALPIIGVAPIMVMWFGFDWQSKAAVVIIMTFFPMLVNTVAGLAASGHMERDLMRTYA
ncbi:ABC transporter permease subunit, partial [Mesorhizobium sp. M7A.F.Ca.CA.004.09.1.2]